MSFASDVEKWASQSAENADLAVRKIALDVFGRVVMRTPVATGRARANWHVSIGQPEERMTEAEDQTGGPTIAAGAAVIESIKGNPQSVFLTNNLPYIEALENGHSDQSPAGMVGVTVVEFGGIVNKHGGKV